MDAQADAQKQMQDYAAQVVPSSGGRGGDGPDRPRPRSLLDPGAITQDEFDTIKAKALA